MQPRDPLWIVLIAQSPHSLTYITSSLLSNSDGNRGQSGSDVTAAVALSRTLEPLRESPLRLIVIVSR